MVKIAGTTITMIKGDTAIINVSITDVDGSEYVPEDGDKIRFAMKRRYSDPAPVLYIPIPTDTMTLIIRPEHTKELQAGQGDVIYKYDIELTKADGTVDTFIPNGSLILLEEVY